MTLEGAGKRQWLRAKRPASVRLDLNDRAISVRDQAPLQAGNVELRHGWTFADLIKLLNEQVYFWPGDASGPSRYGARHYGRYEKEGDDNVILRFRTADLLDSNPANRPKFSRHNSGSPRCSGGKRSPRGDDTFTLADDFDGPPLPWSRL